MISTTFYKKELCAEIYVYLENEEVVYKSIGP